MLVRHELFGDLSLLQVLRSLLTVLIRVVVIRLLR